MWRLEISDLNAYLIEFISFPLARAVSVTHIRLTPLGDRLNEAADKIQYFSPMVREGLTLMQLGLNREVI
jgi:hypothetical protein